MAGFTVADAWMITPRLCVERIAGDPEGKDGFFALPNRRFERTAHAVLNPSRDPAFDHFSQLEWLRHHHVNGEGVENLFLWLGANNALGTIVRMDLKKTSDQPKHPLDMSLDERDQFNLWSAEHFKDEYEELMKRVHSILSAGKTNCNVFVGTVPAVTIAPLACGMGNPEARPDPFGILPSATYIAQEFLKAMRGAGVKPVRDLDWNAIAASDSLYSNPMAIMPELYDNTRMAEGILDLLRLP